MYSTDERFAAIKEAIKTLVEIAIIIDNQDDRNLEYFKEIQYKHNCLTAQVDNYFKSLYYENSKLKERLTNVERKLESLGGSADTE